MVRVLVLRMDGQGVGSEGMDAGWVLVLQTEGRLMLTAQRTNVGGGA